MDAVKQEDSVGRASRCFSVVPASQKGPRRHSILFLTPAVTVDTSSGGMLVTAERLDALTRHHSVSVLTMFVDDAARARFPDVTWHIAGDLRPRNVWSLAKSHQKRLPLSVWRNSDGALLNRAKELKGNGFDLVYVDHWLMIEAANLVPATRRILHLHNAEPEVFFRASERASLGARWVMQEEGRRAATYLRAAMRQFDELHLLSAEDETALEARGISHPTTRVFLPSVAGFDRPINGFDDRKDDALFVGTLSWYANQEGLSWYIDEVLRNLPRPFHHQIVGGGASAALSRKLRATNHLSAHGYVDDLEPFYQSAKCLVAPLLSGSGIKIKIINALARGLPVVTTSCGIEGFPLGFGPAILVQDSPQAFAASVQRLMSDGVFWHSASQAALRYFNTHFQGQKWAHWAGEVGQ